MMYRKIYIDGVVPSRDELVTFLHHRLNSRRLKQCEPLYVFTKGPHQLRMEVTRRLVQ